MALMFVLSFPSLQSNLTMVDNVTVQPIFVMSQDMRSCVQISDVEVPLRAADNGAEGGRIDGRHVTGTCSSPRFEASHGYRQTLCTSASRMRCCPVRAACQETRCSSAGISIMSI
jgi:hypothetical protein